MLIAGLPKKQVAHHVEVHRNTITNWLRDADFLREMQRRLDERAVEVRLRRLHQTTRYTDRLRSLADDALAAAEIRPLDRSSQRTVRLWLDQYRKLLAEERHLGA